MRKNPPKADTSWATSVGLQTRQPATHLGHPGLQLRVGVLPEIHEARVVACRLGAVAFLLPQTSAAAIDVREPNGVDHSLGFGFVAAFPRVARLEIARVHRDGGIRLAPHVVRVSRLWPKPHEAPTHLLASK